MGVIKSALVGQEVGKYENSFNKDVEWRKLDGRAGTYSELQNRRDNSVEFIPMSAIDSVEIVHPEEGFESGLIIHKKHFQPAFNSSRGEERLWSSWKDSEDYSRLPVRSTATSSGELPQKQSIEGPSWFSNLESTQGRYSHISKSIGSGKKDSFIILTWLLAVIEILDLLDKLANTGEKLIHVVKFFSIDSLKTLHNSLIYHVGYVVLIVILLLYK
jgi:hypothetical protein